MERIYRPRPARWPQISLRGFFVLVTLLCVFLGWLGVQLKWIADHYAFPVTKDRIAGCIACQQAPLSLSLFGEEGYGVIAFVAGSDPAADDRAFSEFERLFPEAEVILAGESGIIKRSGRWEWWELGLDPP